MSFKNLQLDTDRISGAISVFVGEMGTFSVNEKKGLQQYEYTTSNQTKGKLNVYIKNDGTVTLTPTGKNQDTSRELATHIKNSCKFPRVGSNNIVLESFSQENLNTVIDFLICVKEASIIEENEIIGGIQYKFKGIRSDLLTFTYYSKGKLMIQGKPLALFHDSLEILYEVFEDRAQVIKAQLAVYDIENVDPDEIKSELKEVLSYSYDSLEEKVRDIISPSLVLRRANVELTDYTCLVFPILKGLEGVLKQLFNKNNVNVGTNGFGEYIHNDRSTNTVTLNTRGQNSISSNKERQAICRLYKHYIQRRHTAFHVDGLVNSTRIMTEQDARDIINSTLELIDDVFKSLKIP